MRHPGTLPALIATLMLSVVSIGSSGVSAAPGQSSPAASAAPQSLAATIRAVDTKTSSVEVITGTGTALRLVRMRVGAACRIKVAGTGAQLGNLRRGHIIRIQYRKAADANVAETIETLSPEATRSVP